MDHKTNIDASFVWRYGEIWSLWVLWWLITDITVIDWRSLHLYILNRKKSAKQYSNCYLFNPQIRGYWCFTHSRFKCQPFHIHLTMQLDDRRFVTITYKAENWIFFQRYSFCCAWGTLSIMCCNYLADSMTRSWYFSMRSSKESLMLNCGVNSSLTAVRE